MEKIMEVVKKNESVESLGITLMVQNLFFCFFC